MLYIAKFIKIKNSIFFTQSVIEAQKSTFKYVDLYFPNRDLVLLPRRHVWRQAGRSLQPGVSLQHRGPSVSCGVRLPSSHLEGLRRRRRHFNRCQFLAQQLRLSAVHAGQPRLQASLPRPVRGPNGNKAKKTKKQTNYILSQKPRLRATWGGDDGLFVLYMIM